MGKVKIINKSRKENKCNKCHSIIPVGSKYYKGELNFSRPIVRCEKCGLASWEVTTSEYQLSVGEIAYRWQENFDLDDSTAEAITSELEDILSETQDKLDNMPDSLQESDTGQILQERIENLESVINDLESIDIGELKSEAVTESEWFGDEDERNYDDIISDEKVAEDVKTELSEALETKLTEAIEEALAGIEI